MIQGVLRYLGLDSATKKLRAETEKNLRLAEFQLEKLRQRLEETKSISSENNKSLNKTLSEGNLRAPQRRTTG